MVYNPPAAKSKNLGSKMLVDRKTFLFEGGGK